MYKYCLINQTSSKTKFEKREETDLIYLSINTVATTILTHKGGTVRPWKEVVHLTKTYLFSLLQLFLKNN